MRNELPPDDTLRARRKELPSDDTIKSWKDEGLTYSEMASRWNIETHGRQLVNPKSFAMRMSRRGWTAPQERCPLIPWTLREEHKHLYEAKMLRRVQQQRKGDKLSDHDASRIKKFLDDLDEQNAVIHYEPDAVDYPFIPVPREWFDEDIIRDPKHKGHTKRPKKAAPKNPRRVIAERE